VLYRGQDLLGEWEIQGVESNRQFCAPTWQIWLCSFPNYFCLCYYWCYCWI